MKFCGQAIRCDQYLYKAESNSRKNEFDENETFEKTTWILGNLGFVISLHIWRYLMLSLFVRNFIWMLTRLTLWVAKCIRLGSVEHRFVWSKVGVDCQLSQKRYHTSNSGIFTGHYDHLIAECNEACRSIASLSRCKTVSRYVKIQAIPAMPEPGELLLRAWSWSMKLLYYFTVEDGRIYGIHHGRLTWNPKIGGSMCFLFPRGIVRFNIHFRGCNCDCKVLSRASVLSEGRLQELSA